MTLEQKINYLEKKFNAPMDNIIQTINFCNTKKLNLKTITINKTK